MGKSALGWMVPEFTLRATGTQTGGYDLRSAFLRFLRILAAVHPDLCDALCLLFSPLCNLLGIRNWPQRSEKTQEKKGQTQARQGRRGSRGRRP